MKLDKNTFRKILPSLVYLLVAIVFFWQSSYIRQSTSSVFGMVTPKTFPRVIIALLAICAVINMVNDLRKKEEVKATIRVPGTFFLVTAIFLFLCMFIKNLGFLLASVIFLPSLFLILDDHEKTKKRVILLIVFGALIAIASVYAFRYGLKVRLPLYPKF